jgi:predicted DNA repair protein MutK
VHGVPALHHWIAPLVERAGGVLGSVLEMGSNAAIGIAAGAVVLAVVTGGKKLFARGAASA